MRRACKKRLPQLRMVDGANTYSVFAIENGQVKIVNAKINMADIDNLMVGTSNIIPGAISGVQQGSATGTNPITITINHGLGSPNITLFASLSGQGNSAQNGLSVFDLKSVTDNTTLESLRISSDVAAPSSPTTTVFSFFTPPADRNSTVFSLSLNVNSFSVSTLKTKLLIMTQKR